MTCFVAGTLIDTVKGPVPVEALRPGMLVATRDNGFRPLRWVGINPMGNRSLLDNPHLRPVHVSADAFGAGLPASDMMVSPNTRLPVAAEKQGPFSRSGEEMLAIKHFINHASVQQVDAVGVRYVHFTLDGHQVVAANGVWVECFDSADYSLNCVGNAQRCEIFELFPELRTRRVRRSEPAATSVLKRALRRRR